MESLGGSLDAMYFAFGATDAFAIAELPDTASAVAASLVASASGAAHATATVLVSPEDVDAASQKAIVYTPPGQ